MSGGSYDYLYSRLSSDLSIPSGHYGINNPMYNRSYRSDVRRSRQQNTMFDQDLTEMMYDVSCLLHSLEWWESCDTSEEQYRADVDAFKSKWFARDSKQSIAEYKQDIKDFLHRLEGVVDDA